MNDKEKFWVGLGLLFVLAHLVAAEGRKAGLSQGAVRLAEKFAVFS